MIPNTRFKRDLDDILVACVETVHSTIVRLWLKSNGWSYVTTTETETHYEAASVEMTVDSTNHGGNNALLMFTECLKARLDAEAAMDEASNTNNFTDDGEDD